MEEEEFDEPVRSWINEHLNELESSIKSGLVVDNDKYFSCTPQILINFFKVSQTVLKETHSSLVFGADEMGLETAIKKSKLFQIISMNF